MVAGGWAWHIECTERPGARAGARARRASDGSEGMLIIFTHVDAAVHYDADAQGTANAHRCPQRCAGIFSKECGALAEPRQLPSPAVPCGLKTVGAKTT